ncbi:MAG: hypothetical protein WCI49_08140 [Ferruginibacter sp.]
MKIFKLILVVLVSSFAFKIGYSQNALINILTQNTGVVKIGQTVLLEVTINNTDPTSYIGVYKIKASISIPSDVITISSYGHVLPTGWTILSNNGSVIQLSNGKDMLAANDARTILIALQAKKIGGPSTISGQLSFSNGIAPGTAPGALNGDFPADNSSTSTCKVIK